MRSHADGPEHADSVVLSGADRGARAVTVIAAGSRLDLLLPANVPVAELMPALLRAMDPGGDEAADRVLVSVGRPAMSEGDTLAAAGVVDGDILLITTRPVSGPQPPAQAVHDVPARLREHPGRGAEAWPWRHGDAPATWAFVLVAVAGLPVSLRWPAALASGLACGAIALVIAAVSVTIHRGTPRPDGTSASAAALAAGCGWAVVAGRHLAVTALGSNATVLGWAIGAATACMLAIAVKVLMPVAVAHLACLAALAGAGAVVGVAVLAGMTTPDVARAAAVTSVLFVGSAPGIAVTASGIAGADHLMCAGMPVSEPEVDRRAEAGRRILLGLLIAVVVMAVWAAAVLLGHGTRWDTLVALGLAPLLALRSRTLSALPQVLTLRTGAMAVLIATAVQSGVHLSPGWLTMLLTAGGAALVVRRAVRAPVGAVTRAAWGRLGRIVERLLTVALVVGISAEWLIERLTRIVA